MDSICSNDRTSQQETLKTCAFVYRHIKIYEIYVCFPLPRYVLNIHSKIIFIFIIFLIQGLLDSMFPEPLYLETIEMSGNSLLLRIANYHPMRILDEQDIHEKSIFYPRIFRHRRKCFKSTTQWRVQKYRPNGT